MSLVDTLPNSADIEQIQEVNRTSFAHTWQYLPTQNASLKTKMLMHRLNSLGDLFYFIKFTLRKNRLSNNFHKYYCDQLMCWSLKEVWEVPRDHFKTTIGAVGTPIWWALPFTDNDEKWMRKLGYGDEYITWMKRVHDQNTRTLIAMEVIKNSWKIGKRITACYNQNNLFKALFPEIQPDSSCAWSADTMTHKRNFNRSGADQGEGTYEFIGVDVALQSRHFVRVVCDDIYGREAMKSELVFNSTWEWFQLLVGAFDSDPSDPNAEADQLVNGNRWSFHDLNWKIRKELPDFRFHTHDAEGGCCPLHPPNQPIFPEEWSQIKLNKYHKRLGDYFYSCQYRNKPIPPGGNQFKGEWLRRFAFKTTNVDIVAKKTDDRVTREIEALIRKNTTSSFEQQGYGIILPTETHHQRHMAIRHEMSNGILRKDILTSNLSKMLLVDPNHKGEKGRANHCIMMLGVNRDPLDIYILDGVADNCSREDAVHHMYRIGEKWRVRIIWVETAAGQTWLKTLLELENKVRKSLGKWYFYEVKEFKDNRSENAKADRIEDTEPYFRRGQIWLPTNSCDDFVNKFLEEYNEYPHSATLDTLDILGHGLQNLDFTRMSEKETKEFNHKMIQRQQEMQKGRNSITGY